MGESQSRYSIVELVERLTDKKLNIMTAMNDLSEDIKGKSQRIDELDKDLETWEKDIVTEVNQLRVTKEREIESAKQTLSNAEDRLDSKEKVYDNKIIAIDAALTKIEEISKTVS